ncbi:MAG: DUF167 domain-containing protein [Chlamydiae bacterium]|nr:DUF167 domain-containing protein [Chlamydiota bacterium]
MKIFVKVKLRAKECRVKKIDENHFEIAVKEPPIEGRANVAVTKALAEFFGRAPSRVKILSGFSSRQKIFEIG